MPPDPLLNSPPNFSTRSYRSVNPCAFITELAMTLIYIHTEVTRGVPCYYFISNINIPGKILYIGQGKKYSNPCVFITELAVNLIYILQVLPRVTPEACRSFVTCRQEQLEDHCQVSTMLCFQCQNLNAHTQFW